MKKMLSTILFAMLVFSGTGVFAQEKATADVTETFATEYMPDTKALLDQLRKIRAADETLYGELTEAWRITGKAEYKDETVGLKNEALGLLERKIRTFKMREGMIVKLLKDFYFKHQAELIEADDLATRDASIAKNGTAWLAKRKDCKTIYALRDAPLDLRDADGANYLIIDLKTQYKEFFNQPPAEGWGDYFKTSALVLRKVDAMFWIGVFEITQDQWQTVMGKNPSKFSGKPDSPMRPVEQVSWNDAMAFCSRLNGLSGIEKASLVFTLPMVKQWELAARGGANHTYSGSDNLYAVGWHFRNSGDQTHGVGTKKPNGFGLYDMSGNVSEWCWDAMVSDLTSDYGKEPSRIYCGGSWYSLANRCEVSSRDCRNPWDSDIGFRVALVPSSQR